MMVQQSWEWKTEGGTQGVHTHEGQVVWWYRPDGEGGRFGEAAKEQSVEDYRANGPAVDSAPPKVIAALDALLERE